MYAKHYFCCAVMFRSLWIVGNSWHCCCLCGSGNCLSFLYFGISEDIRKLEMHSGKINKQNSIKAEQNRTRPANNHPTPHNNIRIQATENKGKTMTTAILSPSTPTNYNDIEEKISLRKTFAAYFWKPVDVGIFL